jgi:signal transduction histidine kinase/ActR/RegA family two-component response regulator
VLPGVGPQLEAILDEVWRTGRPAVNREVSGRSPADPHRERHWLASWYPVRTASGEMLGVGALALDVTAQKEAELALRDADRRKDEFLAMLAHELRNPLAPIRTSVGILRAIGPQDARIERVRDLIDRQVTHMARLVDDLLDVSRITRGRIVLQRSVVPVAEIVEEAVETVRPLVVQHDHSLSVTLGSQALRVHGDRARLVQVIANLLTNAAKFTPRGGHITVSAGVTDDGDVMVQVRDTGVGIPKELQDRIFDLFQQEETTLARSQGGLGIGLTLVKRLVELHGGQVRVHSPGRGAGSEFSVVLPRVDAAAPSRAGAPAADPVATTGRVRVLLVEDNADVAESFQMLLEVAGHDVRVAGSGLEALRLLDDFAPDVAFIDLGLPGMSGFDVARRFRADPRTKTTMLVALTGYGRAEDREEARRAGFDRHLVKPVDVAAVTAILDGFVAGAAGVTRPATTVH